MGMFGSFPDVDIAAISDVIEPRMDVAVESLGKLPRRFAPERFVEHERILERKDIDAVVIATTEHWHGLPFVQACLAGKHVYVEKPFGHSVGEGRAMVTAARKSGVVAVMGTQQRASEQFVKAMEMVQSGKLGRVPHVHCWNSQVARDRPERAADSAPPTGYHWNRWLGPAPEVPYNSGRLEHRWWMEYGGGYMTDWGPHHIDIILGAMNARTPHAISCSARRFVTSDPGNAPDAHEAVWEFPEFVMSYSYAGFTNYMAPLRYPADHGICFYGTQATLIVTRQGYELWNTPDRVKGNQLIEAAPYSDRSVSTNARGLSTWTRRFLDSIKERRPSPLDVERSHEATACCVLANLSWQLGRTIRWDGAAEKSTDPEVNRLLTPPRRSGYELPKS
jgi:predicted dehydrogenase